ncbi:alkyl hydroperoxide reductase subunit C [Schaalia hyovaginalis]|uniref:Alkyl hydroperoxide reductase C n=1 Tax=Schaalia hyovaginalis TaxID=29316 RepID=A0A7K0K945_9ACTO|nr:alkyl hydroperoxide reductase subunit C [Schaalia hyovaginalis]MBB6334790.1 peroxiredoxin (alkyl hydroperoxide reductase subunit C) [Schaalia hyovaginalis]MCF2710320.1 peroxiredoxin [Schaalia hyovaginalis]MCI6556067.1 alkyl hydroperoxide reductase subunit C [Schaalia hyovaginalis]MCI7672538.1 alkyl hydroperoxide reductase subunit C [Schaalia hyovaginalis]MDD7553584.1 alkyl hydroperoxide reductase subunit C [Schaalia hyovaginalis]
MSLINTRIKPFETEAYHNGSFIHVSSDDLQGKWGIVFFYPADFTFVCPTELADLEKVYPELQSLGVEVYSVSRDSHFVHKAWHETSPEVGTLTYPMLGDVNGVITANFDTMRPESGLADRSTFLIDPDGIIQYIETTPEGVGRNAAELVRKVKAAQYVRSHPGEVCPAKWEEGQETLKPSFDLVGKI